MPELPRLKVTTHWVDAQPTEQVLDFEQARLLLFDYGNIVVVEREVVRSYEELVRLASQDRFKGRTYLDVELERIVAGG